MRFTMCLRSWLKVALYISLAITLVLYMAIQKYEMPGLPTHYGKFQSSAKGIIGRFRTSDVDLDRQFDETIVHIAFSSCGRRTEETFVSIKSALLLATSKIMFHIFTDKATRQMFSLLMCMPGVDAVLYVDTDTLFTASPKRTWDLFRNFNPTHIAGMAPNQMPNASSYYDTPNAIPHYGTKGVNSGVMLMNLTRIRAKPWENELAKYYLQYRRRIILGDQDLLNIYFHHYPDELYLCPCGTNYRSDFCTEKLTCTQPPLVLHGNRYVFHNRIEPAFKAVYKAFLSHNIMSPLHELSIVVCIYLKINEKSNCGTALNMFVEEISRNVEPSFTLNHTICTME